MVKCRIECFHIPAKFFFLYHGQKKPAKCFWPPFTTPEKNSPDLLGSLAAPSLTIFLLGRPALRQPASATDLRMTRARSMLLAAAGASLLDCTCAFAAAPALARPAPWRSVLGARPTTPRGARLEMRDVSVPHLEDTDLQALPSNVKQLVGGLSKDLQGRLASVVAERRALDRHEHRAEIQEHAEIAASMVCTIYFENLQHAQASQYCDARLPRRYQDNIERAHNDHLHDKKYRKKPQRRKTLDEMTTTLKHNAEQAQQALFNYAPRRHVEGAPRDSPVIASVAETLELIGVKGHKIDFTKHDGLRYMDIVAEMPNENSVRGLVIQILPEGYRQNYVDIKTAALRKDAWAVIKIKPQSWARMTTTQEHLRYLARALVKSGFWAQHPERG